MAIKAGSSSAPSVKPTTMGIRVHRRNRKLVNSNEVIEEIKKALDKKIGQMAIDEFNKVIGNWKSDVSFSKEITSGRDKVTLFVIVGGEDKKVWFYVSRGTDPHPISGAPLMNFIWGGPGSYTPKTTTSGGIGGPGSSSGSDVAFFTVQHPGNEARDFEKGWMKKETSSIMDILTSAIRDGLNVYKADVTI